MATTIIKLKSEFNSNPLYQICRQAYNYNISSLGTLSALDEVYLLRLVAPKIDYLRKTTDKFADIAVELMSFAPNVYRILRRDNKDAAESELRHCTMLTGSILALFMAATPRDDIATYVMFVSKGMQRYGDSNEMLEDLYECLNHETIDALTPWFDAYWESEESMIDEKGELVPPRLPVNSGKVFDTIKAADAPFPERLKQKLLSYVQSEEKKYVLWISMYRALTDMKIIDLSQADFGKLMEKTFDGEKKAKNVDKTLSYNIKGESTTGYLQHAFVLWERNTKQQLDNHELITMTQKLINETKKFLEENSEL